MDRINFVILKNPRNNSDEPFRLNIDTIKKYRPWYNPKNKTEKSTKTVLYITDGKTETSGMVNEDRPAYGKKRDPDEDLHRIIIEVPVEDVDKVLGVYDLREKPE